MAKRKIIIQSLFSFFIFNFSFLISSSQGYNPLKVKQKVADLYASAYDDAQKENYSSAIKKLDQTIIMDSTFVDAYLSKAGIFADIKKYDSSVANFEKAIRMDSIYTKTYLLPYSNSLAGTGNFKKALNAINSFLNYDKASHQGLEAAKKQKTNYEFAIDYEKKHPSNNYIFAPVNLGDSINTTDLEYYPSLTIDGKKLVFTKRINSDEDFYESDFINGKWSKAKPLPGKVNTNFNEGAQTISQDGQWIIFAGCNYPEGFGSCDLYISYKTKTGWSEAENLGGNVNTDAWESAPTLSSDKRDLYFSSNRPGGYGGKDIWVTHRQDNGQWSNPENLGPNVNTSGDESCPFIYPDNQTLFFNSTGLPGYGQSDLYFTKKLNDSTWSTPENLGYPINTINDEGSLIVAPDGITAYYASDRSDSRGGLDLYSFKLREDIRPPKTLWIKGKVYDSKTKNGLPTDVELIETDNNHLISKLQTDEDGNYLTTLPVGKKYVFNVNRKGYLFFSESFDMRNIALDSIYTKDIALQPIEAGASIVLKNIFFDTKKSELKEDSKIELNKVIQLMKDNPNLIILISGHTDSIGQEKDNLVLSNDRAQAVVKYLLSSRQISKDRVQHKGFGATKPIAENSSEAGRALNRRTELSVLSN